MEWHLIGAAVATSVSMHSAMEPGNILQKLQRLAKAVNTGVIDEPKVKGIDTRAKAYMLGAGFVIFMALIAYLVLSALDPGVEAALQYSVLVLVVGDFVSTVRIDKYHADIEKLTQAQGKKKK